MKKFAIIFSTLILGFVFVMEAQAAKRGEFIRPYLREMLRIKSQLHSAFAREERAFPALTAYINDESKPAFQMLKKKLDNKETVNWTEAEKAAFAEASGMNTLVGANVVTAQKDINLRKDIEQKKAEAAAYREAMKVGKDKLKTYMDEDDTLTRPLNEKAKAVDATADNVRKESEDGKKERDAARDKKADNIGGPIWNHKEELKVAADKLEDVAKILESSKGFAKDAADKIFKEVGIDPTQLAKDIRTVAKAMGPMNDTEIDAVKQLLKDRYDQAKREHDRIYSASAKDRAEAAGLKKELDDADKEIAERDASRKWHDQFADNLVAACGKDIPGCPVYLAAAAAERAAAAKEQSHIGLLRAKQMFLMPIYMQKTVSVGFSDTGLLPHKTIMEKLDEQIQALDVAKGKLKEHRDAERKRTYQEYYDAAANHGKLKEEYEKMFSEYEKNTTLKDHLTYWKGWVEFEEKRVAKIDEEVFKMERDLAQLTGAPTPAAPSRSVQSLAGKPSAPAPLVGPREGPLPEKLEFSKEEAAPLSNKFADLQKKMKEQDLKKEAEWKAAGEKIAAEQQRKMAEHEKVMAQKQKELAALERKAAEAATEAKRVAEETEVRKKAQEELAKKKALEEEAAKKKEQEELALKKKKEEELARRQKLEEDLKKAEAEAKKKEEELALKKAEEEKIRQAQEEAKRIAEEQARKKAEEELALKKKKEQEWDVMKRKEMEERTRKKTGGEELAEKEAARKKELEEIAKKSKRDTKKKPLEEGFKKEPKVEEPLIAAPPPPPPPSPTSAPKTGMRPKQKPRYEEEPVYRAPPAPPSREEVEVERKQEEETTVWRHPEPPEEKATPQCDRGTWSPTFQRCIEDEAPEETARPDCGEGMHWSPTLQSCQSD